MSRRRSNALPPHLTPANRYVPAGPLACGGSGQRFEGSCEVPAALWRSGYRDRRGVSALGVVLRRAGQPRPAAVDCRVRSRDQRHRRRGDGVCGQKVQPSPSETLATATIAVVTAGGKPFTRCPAQRLICYCWASLLSPLIGNTLTKFPISPFCINYN